VSVTWSILGLSHHPPLSFPYSLSHSVLSVTLFLFFSRDGSIALVCSCVLSFCISRFHTRIVIKGYHYRESSTQVVMSQSVSSSQAIVIMRHRHCCSFVLRRLTRVDVLKYFLFARLERPMCILRVITILILPESIVNSNKYPFEYPPFKENKKMKYSTQQNRKHPPLLATDIPCSKKFSIRRVRSAGHH